MPGTGKYGITSYDQIGQNSVTNSDLYDTIYHHKDSQLTHEQLIEVARALLTPDVASSATTSITGLPNTQDVEGPMCDPLLFPNGVNMNYQGGLSGIPDVPTYDGVKAVAVDPHKGAEGWPTTVYTPPLASPGAGNGADYSQIPVTDITEQDVKPTYPGPGGTDGTVAPATTSAQISSTKLSATQETLVKGSRPQ